MLVNVAASTPNIAIRARSDERDWLLEADEPLATLHCRSGGHLPGPIVNPALLELVRKARSYRLKLASIIHAQDSQEQVTALAEVTPDEDGLGCVISLSSWRSEAIAEIPASVDARRREALIRHIAGLSARLGPDQSLVSVECSADELDGLAETMRKNIGINWTELVNLKGHPEAPQMHWRLLDGAEIALEENDQDTDQDGSNGWTAHLIPIGALGDIHTGFELYFVEREQAVSASSPSTLNDGDEASPSQPWMGREIAPILRQPVSRIIANAETIRTQLAGPLADEYSNYASDIAMAGEHLLSLIDDLTALEMVENAEFSVAPDEIDLNDLAERAKGILGVRARERDISLTGPDDSKSAPAIGEFRRVLQILLNLIGNAIRYSPEGTQIRIVTELQGDMARITVTDEGDGLSESAQKRIFDKFERLGRQGDGGSGLGLYISRRLANAMGGSLTVASSEGQGASFTLEIPANLDG